MVRGESIIACQWSIHLLPMGCLDLTIVGVHQSYIRITKQIEIIALEKSMHRYAIVQERMHTEHLQYASLVVIRNNAAKCGSEKDS